VALFLAANVAGLVWFHAQHAYARPVNGDEITTSIVTGNSGRTIAAVVIGVGVLVCGVLALQRFLHAAVDAS
jgi:uncharacterized membrane protein